MPEPKPVVVTTEHNGVFFGFLPDPTQPLHLRAGGNSAITAITLTDARMCVYWSEQMHGILGLAATGPDSQCRITPAVPEITITAVTAVMTATDEAVTAWQAGPWS